MLDQVYFNYLVINLVDNAIKYGGDEPWVKVVFYRENWDWVLTVTDRGIGMPERVLKRIFRQFYRVKDKKVKNKTGFGLGLAFAKKVVNAYGGEIRVLTSSMRTPKPIIKQWCDPLMTFHKHCSCYSLLTLR